MKRNKNASVMISFMKVMGSGMIQPTFLLSGTFRSGK
jgi:hypothetical protein